MDAHGYASVMPRSAADPSMPTEPFIDLTPATCSASIDQFPQQGTKAPWRLYQNYMRDVLLLRHGTLVDDALEFSKGGRRTTSRDKDRAPAA